jgi:cobalt/nickel transport protein
MNQRSDQQQNHSGKNSAQGNWWLVLSVIALAILPPFLIDGKYTGADGEAEKMIREIEPNYQPWFKAIFEPASAEIENLLFVSQAAIGAGVVGYVIGLYKGRTQANSELTTQKGLTTEKEKPDIA